MMTSRIIVVSNRLPIVLSRGGDGSVQATAGSGGLVKALEPVVERTGGTWIGWPGIPSDEVSRAEVERALANRTWRGLRPVWLTRAEVEGYYAGFANSVIWPLFHGLPDRCEFGRGAWKAYQRVNRRFADAAYDAAYEANGGDDVVVWIHDYHLIHVAEALRARGAPARLGYFLHTPFPTLDDFVKLPCRGDLLRAFLAHDVIGFQSPRDLRRFLACVEQLAPGAGVARRGPYEVAIAASGRTVTAGVFPIGIDCAAFERATADAQVAGELETLRAGLGDRAILLGVDRLDYTKGLLERLAAYERALERHPELAGRVVFVQVVVPSRETVPAYAALKRDIERLVGRINGRHATTDWEPIRYLYTSLAPEKLRALYRAADVALVTPLADGMNLVAKEYCASNVSEDGVLVLSELAGAASQLQGGAVLVNPYDEEGMADAIWEAYAMPRAERVARMRRLRRTIAASDVFWWGEAFLSSLLREEPAPAAAAEYLPTIDLEPRQAGA